MKHTPFGVITALLCSILLLSACSLGFEPAWKAKNGKAAISLQFKTIEVPATDSSGRAIVQGGGYLYLRTFDGPTGDNGPFYGPYTVRADNKIEILDIPAGTYSHIGFVYSAQKFDEMQFVFPSSATQYSFKNMMLLSYDEVLPLFENSEEGPSPVDNSKIEDGSVSLRMTGETTIKDGMTNYLSVTLIPIAGTVFDLENSQSYEITPTVPGSPVRKFVRLINVTGGLTGTQTVKNLICTAIPSGGAALVKTIILYTEDGASVPTEQTTIDGNKVFIAPYPGNSNFFLYVEYNAASLALAFDLELDISGDPTNVLNVDFTGGTAVYYNTNFFFGVYDTDAFPMDGPPTGPPTAYGIISIDASGKGLAVTAISPDTDMPYILNPGTTYYINGFADLTHHYDSVTTANIKTVINGINPNFGDYSGKGSFEAEASGPTNFTFTAGELYLFNEQTYYVSQAGGGDGTSSATPCTLDVALADIGINGPGRRNRIILMGNVTQTVSVTITSEVNIGSFEEVPTPFMISFSPGTATTNVYTVNAGGRLSMKNVIADASGRSAAFTSLIKVTEGGIFYLQKDAVIRNSNLSSGNGGAISLSGSTFSQASFQLFGGMITNCSATNGGAVYIGMHSNMKIELGSSITLNTASGEGGGVYLEPNNTVIHDPSNSVSSMISGNSATTDPNYRPDANIDISVMKFVSAAPRGTGDGMRPENACTFASALAGANVSGIALVENITLTAGAAIDTHINIRSMDDNTYRIYLGADLIGPMFTVGPTGTLSMRNVTVGPAATNTYTASSLVEVLDAGKFDILTGTTLLNNTTSGKGGAVFVRTGGTCNLGSTLFIEGPTITSIIADCAAAYGGGVYVENNGYLNANTGFTDYAISGNTSTAVGSNGGGIYLEMNAFFNETMPNGWMTRVTGNFAPGLEPNLYRFN